ncbi:MAG TPA: aspartate/glutamate racemase family protein [Clostridia bacterium]|nr:aspartate/glutamate racemase family protein [Clostridia bacterium]
MNIKGGYTNYGQDIGILMMPTVFPRLLGDIGNARTFKIPVRYRIVQNVEGANLNIYNAQERLLMPFIRAAQSLEQEGCKAITTSCSFLSGFQRQLSDAVNIPVFTSTLLMAPMVHTMLNRRRKIAILTINPKLMTEEYFNQSGWSSKDIPVCVSGLTESSEFSKLIIGDFLEGDVEKLKASVLELTQRHMAEYPDTGAILLECPNYAPFASLIQKAAGVPVFGINQLIEFIDACVNAPEYSDK